MRKGQAEAILGFMTIVLGIIVIATIGGPLKNLLEGLTGPLDAGELIIMSTFILFIVIAVIIRGINVGKGRLAPDA